jgi:signal transduction histidine kinase
VARRHGATDEDQADLAEELDRLSRLVEDLLVLARLDAAESLPVPDPPAEPSLVLPAFAGNGSPLVSLAGVDDGTLPMSRLELERVVGNLVDNASRHARSRVDLSFRRTSEEAVVSVVDDGAGIPDEDRERVFDRFARLDDARARDTGGTGLGLAIARELVRRRGGELTLGDAPDGGLLAEVRFPGEDVPPHQGRGGTAAASGEPSSLAKP